MFIVLLSNIFFAFLLLPYFSPIPIYESDIQPIAGILAAILFTLKLTRKEVRLSKFGFLLFVYSLFSISYISIAMESSFTISELKKRIGLLYMFLLYFAIRETNMYFKLGVFLTVVVFNFAAYVFHQLSPDLFKKSLGLFIREVKIVDFSYRGASGLAPENSFASFNAVYYVIVMLYFRHVFNANSAKYKYMYKLLLVISSSLYIIINSKSGIGYLMTLLLILTAILESRKLVKKILLLLGAILGLVIVSELVQLKDINVRAINIFRNLLTDPWIVFYDSSIGHRLLNLLTAFFVIINYPFGLGGGSYFYAINKVEYLLYAYYPSPEVVNTIHMEDFGLVSPFAQYVIEHGLIFVLFFIYMVHLILKSKTSFKYTLSLFLFFATLFFPITHPALAFLMGAIIDNKKLRASRS